MSIQFSGSLIIGSPTSSPTNVALASLTDVSVVTPSAGQVLTYNPGSQNWQNQGVGNSVYQYLTTGLTAGAGIALTFTPGSPGTVQIATNITSATIVSALGFNPINKIGDTVSGAYNFSGGSISGLAYTDYNVLTTAPAYSQGRVFYIGGTDQTLCYYNDESRVLMNIGQESWVRVKNISGATIPSGSPVYITGTQSGLPTIALASASSISTANVVGITAHNIENNINGYVSAFGLIKNLNTSVLSSAAIIYLGTVAGTLVTTAPVSPALTVQLGSVITVDTTVGTILVKLSGLIRTALSTSIIAAGNITSTNVQSALYELDTKKLSRDGSQPMLAALSMGGFNISNAATPVVSTDVATKGYVDSAVTSSTPLASCQASTVAALSAVIAAGTGAGKTLTASANGALVVDGYTPIVGNRILVKNQSGAAANPDNGIYVVTATGSSSAVFVLTRSTDFNTTAKVITGSATFIENGTGNGSTTWSLLTANPTTVDTTPLQFGLSSRAPPTAAGTGLSLNINTLSVNLGAGIVSLPTNQVGVDVHPSGGLFTTIDNSTSSTDTSSQLAVNIDGTSLSKSTTGLKVAIGGITGTELSTTVAGGGLIGGGGIALSVGTANSGRIVINSHSIDLATTGVTASSYNVVVVDSYGRINAAFLRSLTPPASGISITNPTGVSGNPTISLADDLAAIEGITGTGLAARTGTSAWITRSIATSGTGFTVANGDGIGGNPTLISNATSAGTFSTLVARDSTGNFTATTITANLTGTASNALSVPFTGITSKPTTVSGYGISDAVTTSAGGSFANTASLITSKTSSGTGSTTANSSLVIGNVSGTGDSNLALMSFMCNGSYALNMHLRADGYFGIGGWSSPTWRWYSDASGNMSATGDIIAYSDPRLKKNISNITNALDKVLSLNGVNFTWIDKEGLGKAGKADVGILSSEVDKVLPEAVFKDTLELDGVKYQQVAYDKLIPLLIEAIKELNIKVDDLQTQLSKKP